MAAGTAASKNQAAVLHGIDDLRLQDWPLPDTLAPGQVAVITVPYSTTNHTAQQMSASIPMYLHVSVVFMRCVSL